MTRMTRRPLFVLMAALAAALGILSASRSGAEGTVPGHVLARLKTGVDAKALANQYGSAILDYISATQTYSLKDPVGMTEATFVARLVADSRVAWAQIDTYLFSGIQSSPNTQYHYAFDFGHDSANYINQYAFDQVHLGVSHQMTQGSGVVVAVIDTGATFTHPDLQGHLLPGYNVMKPSALPAEVADGKTNAGMGHGTMICGIIARLAPEANILPIRALNADGLGTLMNIAKAVNYAIDHGAKVINMSFGGSSRMNALNDALDRAEASGVVTVCSAGNAGKNTVQYPAAGKGAIAVAAVESDDTKSYYSNYGSFIRVVAPGTGIRSTYYDGGYASWSGTSFSAPIVAAEAALCFSVNHLNTSAIVQDAIRGTAHSVDNVNPLYKGWLGKGIVDIENAVKSVR